MDDEVRIRYVSLPVAFEQSLDGISYDYGDDGLGKVLRLLCACASQQAKKPFYMIDVTGDRGWALLARKLGFDVVTDCIRFVTDLRAEGLCDIAKDGNHEYLHCPVVDGSVDGYRARVERSKRAAEARWEKKSEGGEATG